MNKEVQPGRELRAPKLTSTPLILFKPPFAQTRRVTGKPARWRKNARSIALLPALSM